MEQRYIVQPHIDVLHEPYYGGPSVYGPHGWDVIDTQDGSVVETLDIEDDALYSAEKLNASDAGA